MDRHDYITHHRELCDEARALSIAKNHDYTGDADNPFANFERVEALGICGTATGFLVRITDKVSRLATFARHQRLAVADESVRDTIVDAINYLALLSAWVESRRMPKLPVDPGHDHGDEA
jgi:hypothetical protein